MDTTHETKPATTRPRKMARKPKANAVCVKPKRTTKIDQIVTMLTCAAGATLDELFASTGWQPHTTRAALTGLKKKGHIVTSEKLDGVRRYRIEGGAG
ncbi:DUF3489 domain-containing protein [Novosphingobium sp.]|uniref:DUF3489 domain-containing protein n=1 Tax=Novosphingobium sp. TaxID=1874826 RepID=UPI00286E4FF1|nr:DUF3489 domain-containing protein [Novosphingobium sp.]